MPSVTIAAGYPTRDSGTGVLEYDIPVQNAGNIIDRLPNGQAKITGIQATIDAVIADPRVTVI